MQNNDTVLFVSPGPDLNNPASGEGTRLRNLSLELSECGWQVFTLVPEKTDDTTPDWVTKQYRYRQWSLPHLTDLNPFFLMTLKHVLSKEDIDVIHLSTGVCTAKLLTLIDSDTTVVYAAQNVEADHAQDFVDPDLPIYKRLLGPQLIPLIEWATVRCADGITTVSDKDKKRFVNRYGLAEEIVEAVPTGTTAVDREELRNPSEVRNQLEVETEMIAVFHGHYSHPPNREAAELIDQQIAPAIAEQDIDVTFLLVGKDPPKTSSPNVHTTGFVDDLFSVLNAADVAIVPILYGGGTKTKLYDYVSLSIPMVATKKATEGVDLVHDEHVLSTKDINKEFVANLADVLQRQAIRTRIQKNLLNLDDVWSWETSVEYLMNAYDNFN